MDFIKKSSKGFSLLELTLAIGLFMIFVAGLGAAAIGGHLTGLENAKMAKAEALVTESWEAVRAICNNDWANVANDDHGLSAESGHWIFSGTSDLSDGFVRTITVSDVRRDDLGNIVQSGGEVDPDTKRVAFDLSWEPSSGQLRTLHFESYLTNYSDPGVWPIPAPEPPPGP